MRQLLVLGATGSVGRNTLDVAARHPQDFTVWGLTAHQDEAGLAELCRRHRPRHAAIGEPAAARRLQETLRSEGLRTEVHAGAEALAALAADPEAGLVMSAIVGAAGLLPTLAAVCAGKTVLIANKEPLVMAGELLMQAARDNGAVILPIDSEHNAIFQCLPAGYVCGQRPEGVQRLILTASGGPFREHSREQLAAVTPEQAVRHPNWSMGRKISVDSATLMNKGLELIEACALYALPESAVEVVVHPESLIHSLVEYRDGSLLAQLGQPDMRIPIAHALAWPERRSSGVGGLDLARIGQMRFLAPDLDRFPSLALARAAARAGGDAPNRLNAANEVAVEAFLAGRMAFLQIPRLIEAVLAQPSSLGSGGRDLGTVLAVDAEARRAAADWLEQYGDA
ncbi:MAG TPA: 1-deoxy-D-xylulose-5-phosphate reductoisomerase [Nevskiaceae bacterium]|nr:1-deoxy-D-xylulose-5-phosphate reductoisomerase [Nevskiaceae bacterium]